MSELVKLKLEEECIQKKLDKVRKKISKVESKLNNNSLHNKLGVGGIFLNDQDLHKLLCLLNHTIVSDDSVESKNDREKLWDYLFDLIDDIGEHFGYDLYEGDINPHTYEFTAWNVK